MGGGFDWFGLLDFCFVLGGFGGVFGEFFWFSVSDSLVDVLVLLFSFTFVFQMRSFLLAYGVHVGQGIAVVNCGNNLHGDCFFLE